jgi:DNA repair and recombination protein RAD52
MGPPGIVQGGNITSNPPPQPHTPNAGFSRSSSGAGLGMQRPPQDSAASAMTSLPGQPVLAPVIGGRVLNQPSRLGNGIQAAPASPTRVDHSSSLDEIEKSLPPQGTGFFSARAAARIPEGVDADPLPPSHTSNLPAFNPNLESPSIRKTPGIDHKKSKPLTRDGKHVPGGSQAAASAGPEQRPSIMNPHLDATRRIGAPGGSSPVGNRGQYKPPTMMKRPVDAVGGGLSRAPLLDLPANGAMGPGEAGGDAKRQRLNN